MIKRTKEAEARTKLAEQPASKPVPLMKNPAAVKKETNHLGYAVLKAPKLVEPVEKPASKPVVKDTPAQKKPEAKPTKAEAPKDLAPKKEKKLRAPKPVQEKVIPESRTAAYEIPTSI